MKNIKTLSFMVAASIGLATMFSACKTDEPKPNDPLTYDEGVVINGVKWATRNVDKPGTFAETPESGGLFYQWGRKIGWSITDPMINTNGGTDWQPASPDLNWESYNDPSPNGWRVPNMNDYLALVDTRKVRQEWTSQKGMKGIRYTDKESGKSIFFPACGYRMFVTGIYNGTLFLNEDTSQTFPDIETGEEWVIYTYQTAYYWLNWHSRLADGSLDPAFASYVLQADHTEMATSQLFTAGWFVHGNANGLLVRPVAK